ncbi:ATP-binding protein [Streptomyces sp. XH2]|uniref:ATP-binding protein n=1 Tax=Streptomyces sp. XH2 TaxID=3412483 RepID=UPI003C7A2511
MDTPRSSWRNTTHDWASTVDLDHLASVRRSAGTFAPGGVRHLVLEVVAYAADEAECSDRGEGRCVVTLHPDGSVSVADDGRGTDTRVDDRGHAVKKPVMATKDLRFFDRPGAQLLPDGHPRRGMSVVAALSEWLVHTNRRRNGSWTQRYEHGVPVSDLTPVADDGSSGTVVHFRPGEDLRATGALTADELIRLATPWQRLSVEVVDRRAV